MSLKVLKNSINTYYNFSKKAQPIILKDLTQEKIDKLLDHIDDNLELLKRKDVKYVIMELAKQENIKAIELLDPDDHDMYDLLNTLQKSKNQKIVDLVDKKLKDYDIYLIEEEKKYYGDDIPDYDYDIPDSKDTDE